MSGSGWGAVVVYVGIAAVVLIGAAMSGWTTFIRLAGGLAVFCLVLVIMGRQRSS